jgi:hypothetical protein
MFKKAALAVFGLVLTVTLMAPQKAAAAQVHIGVNIGTPAPVVVQPAPVVVYEQPYIVAHYWDSGIHGGYYYERGTRYRLEHGHRYYDDRYREGRARYDRERHDHGNHRGWDKQHDGDRRDHGHHD